MRTQKIKLQGLKQELLWKGSVQFFFHIYILGVLPISLGRLFFFSRISDMYPRKETRTDREKTTGYLIANNDARLILRSISLASLFAIVYFG